MTFSSLKGLLIIIKKGVICIEEFYGVKAEASMLTISGRAETRPLAGTGSGLIRLSDGRRRAPYVFLCPFDHGAHLRKKVYGVKVFIGKYLGQKFRSLGCCKPFVHYYAPCAP